MKTSRGRELLTDNQRTELMQIPTDEWILGTYYTNFKDPDSVSLEKGRLSLARLEKDIPTEAQAYSASLYKLLPSIKLTDLFMDVAHLTGFHEQFTHASSNLNKRKSIPN